MDRRTLPAGELDEFVVERQARCDGGVPAGVGQRHLDLAARRRAQPCGVDVEPVVDTVGFESERLELAECQAW